MLLAFKIHSISTATSNGIIRYKSEAFTDNRVFLVKNIRLNTIMEYRKINRLLSISAHLYKK